MICRPQSAAASLAVAATAAVYAFSTLASTSTAFVVPPPSSSVSTTTMGTAAVGLETCRSPLWSVLYAEEQNGGGGGGGGTDGGGSASSPSDSVSSAATDNLPANAGSDILNSPAFLKRKLEVLKTDIEKTQASLEETEQRVVTAKEEWGPQLELLQTEYSNIQDRMSNQRNAGDTQAIVTVVKAVLELLDNFDRAYGVVKPATPDEEAIEAEYKQAYQQILDTFAKLGVREVETVGTEFDYELHQAVMQIPDPNYEEGIVCQEFQKGFVMGEEKEPKAEDESENEDDEDDEGTPLTLIRPAMVAVAA
eukprot:CAMPEP_0113451444 /NCGR_PEP_ID=MMETSP0014_2-20120614/6341_1 /TAXON_ID=2857 /ORGANISM="Nitzschia sp." /LENGTH=307 /DNA_ID=CAMNT_0000342799 /DNA_START=146 /DNA_END=1069 /DNA_ORIENTATION=+ /assembly_acc=CAM_ASM_000159